MDEKGAHRRLNSETARALCCCVTIHDCCCCIYCCCCLFIQHKSESAGLSVSNSIIITQPGSFHHHLTVTITASLLQHHPTFLNGVPLRQLQHPIHHHQIESIFGISSFGRTPESHPPSRAACQLAKSRLFGVPLSFFSLGSYRKGNGYLECHL